MSILLGVVFHFIGGAACGSFYLPYSKVRKWSWESYWIVGGVFSWLICPLVAAAITIPDFAQIIADTPTSTLFWTYLMGVLWGVGGLTFGLAMRYLGISLGMSVALGFTSAFGALVPPIYRDLAAVEGIRFSGMFTSSGGQLVLLGVVVCLVGIAICGWAGVRKDRDLIADQMVGTVKEFNLSLGLSVAVFAGILSACMSFGIQAGEPLAKLAVERGNNPLFQTNVILVVLLWGGLTTNLLWCMILNARNKSFGDYVNGATPLLRNYLFAAIAGSMWFLQFFFYGMGASKLSNGPSSWILHMAFIILVSNTLGILFNEWKGVTPKTLHTQLLGIAVIIMSVCIVGYGDSLAYH
ncbi:MAG: L-rhamnose/proton symporter RhaT [Gammaproteobacteria bacterium]|nr:L-rhamnose/proton symporter RhaT [Gammaproteobacteria bacterium]